ncbi:lipocalin family protein [Pseudofulvibacter geojedonensis]|uniref:Lipocalin family protein n=1 Tax=Pseudofulvibacter geojedonensis TaxID=1123758 RepID=A0ABW3I6M6_9FLAO
MKKTITIILVLLVSSISFAQNEKMIEGKWKFKNLYEEEKLEEKDIQTAKMFFKDMSISFSEGNYDGQFMGVKDTGTYKVKGQKKIIMTSNKEGRENAMLIIKVSKNELIIGMGKGGKDGKFVMQRIEPADEALKQN